MRSLNQEQRELLRMPFERASSTGSLALLIEQTVVLAPLATFGRPGEGPTVLNNPIGIRKSIEMLIKQLLLIGNHLDVLVEDAVWEKYPGFCPYPGCENVPCICPPQKRGVHRRYAIAKPKDLSLEELRQMCAEIYTGDVPGEDDLEQVSLVMDRYVHFLSELGEIAKEVGRGGNNSRKIREEVADAFVWLMALANVFGVTFT